MNEMADSDLFQTEEDKKLAEEQREQEHPSQVLADHIRMAQLGYDWRYLSKLKAAVETRVEGMAVGDALMGRASQVVPIIPDQLVLKYRELVIAAREKIEELVAGLAPGTDTYLRKYYNYVLAFTIADYNDTDYANPVKSDGEIDAEALDANYKKVRRQGEAVFWLVWYNYTWFVGRIQDVLNAETAKNG